MKSGKLYEVQGQIGSAFTNLHRLGDLIGPIELSQERAGWVGCKDSLRKNGTKINDRPEQNPAYGPVIESPSA